MIDSNFVLDHVDGLHGKCNQISLNNDVPYIDSSDCMKQKKTR